MTWQPPPRAAWAETVNRSEIEPITEEASRPLDKATLLGEAAARAMTEPTDVEDEALDVLLPALEDEAHLTILGRWLTRRFLLRLLGVRLALDRYDDAPDDPVAAPVVITGLPRAGTTLLHALLAADPDHRAPTGWELLYPVPPPNPAARETDARVALAADELRVFARVLPGFDAVHEYGARNPKECLSAMSFVFRSEELTARYDVPSYARWLERCDMRPAYEVHRLVFGLLQRRTGPSRWVLKSPVHLRSLPTLLDVYPDARVVVTHRDPLVVLGAVTSLVARLRWIHSDRVDFPAIGREHARRYHADLEGLESFADRVHHVRYTDLVADPLRCVRGVYDAFGLPYTGEAETPMRAYLQARPKDRHGTHEYAFADLGLDEGAERARFAAYQEAFGVPAE